jgi:hypothetical protein
MPKKKTADESVKETVKKVENNYRHHYPFISLVVIFSTFSLWGIFSFYGSTSNYIDHMYASVLDNGANVEARENGESGGDNEIIDAVMYQYLPVFSDVGETYVNAEAIVVLYNEGVISGYSDGTFRPDNKISRAEFWAIVTNALDSDFGGMTLENCFTDVQDQWFAVFVCYAKNQGWVSGFEDGSYKPEQIVTKAEALKMALQAFNYSVPDVVGESSYRDVNGGDWYAPYAEIAFERQLISSSSFFAPGYHMRRSDAAQIVYNIMKDSDLL